LGIDAEWALLVGVAVAVIIPAGVFGLIGRLLLIRFLRPRLQKALEAEEDRWRSTH
jgi:hypothetical protein